MMLTYWRLMDEELQPYKETTFFIGAVKLIDDRVEQVAVSIADILSPR